MIFASNKMYDFELKVLVEFLMSTGLNDAFGCILFYVSTYMSGLLVYDWR